MSEVKAGQPSKYNEAFCDLLIDHMSHGYSFQAFAAVIKVNQDTLYEWVKTHPEFAEAKARAFDEARLFWEKLGIEGMWTTSGEGSSNLNATLWIYNMKNRFPKEWRDRTQTEISGPEGGPVEATQKLSFEQLGELVKIARETKK